jgi:hypothetical protein
MGSILSGYSATGRESYDNLNVTKTFIVKHKSKKKKSKAIPVTGREGP